MIGLEEIGRLEEIGHASWPALEDERLDGWLLRAAGGATRRSNSASPGGASLRSVAEQIATCEAWYEARGLPPMFRLTRAADPAVDDLLEERGYVREPGAAIMTRTVEGLKGLDQDGVDITEAPAEGWLDVMAREPGRGGEMRGVLNHMLGRLSGRAGFASVTSGGRVASIGLGVAVDHYLALYMMQTVPERRRQGLGTAIAAALASWGAQRGAQNLFLQVHPENAVAAAFYRELGFEPQYEYWYRLCT